jgi:DNA polymerase III epsilon subunit family exonuclease
MNIHVLFIIFGIAIVVGVFLALPTSERKNRSRKMPKFSDLAKSKLSAEDVAWDQIPDEFIIFDLVTTGLKSTKLPVDIIEISAIKVIKNHLRNGHTLETFTALVKPKRGNLNLQASAVNGITQEMIDNDGDYIRTALSQFIEFSGNRLLVAYNVDFDRWFLNRELREHDIKKRYKYECAYLIARKAFPNLENYKLTTVASKLEIDLNGAHRALADCLMTLQVYLWGKTFANNRKDVFDAISPCGNQNKPELVGTD